MALHVRTGAHLKREKDVTKTKGPEAALRKQWDHIDSFSFSPVGRIQYIDSGSPLQFVTERAASVPEELMHFMLRVSHDSMAVGPAGGTLPLLITHTTSLYI